MPQAVESTTSALEQLSQQVKNLELRVAALERREEPTAKSAPAEIALERPRPPATWRGFPPVEGSSRAVAILGRAVLGIAGAYLLRALAESSSIPRLPVLLIAILYAYCWMILAVRVHRSSRFASATYAVTSALILSPLLWESTIRFHVCSPAFASACLVVFTVLAITMARSGTLQLIPWIATLSSVSTAVALIVATRDVAPLSAALLATGVAFEVAACTGQKLTVRFLPALAADFAVWLVVYVMTYSEGVPEGYHPVGASTIALLSLGLMGIYGGSIGIRDFVSRERISLLDIVQGVLAFTVGSFGALRSSHANAVFGLGVSFLVLAAGCYWGAVSRFSEESYRRNRRVAATWALALLLAGTFLLFPRNWQADFLCLGAITVAFAYARLGKLSLGMHVSVYLAVAAAVSPLSEYVANALAGTVPSSLDWHSWTVAITAVLCYGIGARRAEENGRRRLLWVIPALLFGFAIAAVVVVAVVHLSGGRVESQASLLSVVRTITNCALAVIFGFLASRLKRVELGWAAYAAVGFGTIKLLFEDLRFGNAASLVVSLLFYGLVLILLPRLAGREREAGE